MHRIRAEILLKRDPANTAAGEQSLQAAIAIAQSQRARSFELRAALSLARLYCAANRRADNVNFPRSDNTFPGGAGPDAMNNDCLICHSAGMVLDQATLSQAGWQGLPDNNS
jgi:hypothetical protein